MIGHWVAEGYNEIGRETRPSQFGKNGRLGKRHPSAEFVRNPSIERYESPRQFERESREPRPKADFETKCKRCGTSEILVDASPHSPADNTDFAATTRKEPPDLDRLRVKGRRHRVGDGKDSHDGSRDRRIRRNQRRNDILCRLALSVKVAAMLIVRPTVAQRVSSVADDPITVGAGQPY